ncbi:MAG: tetratricopeptide repeat protein [Betaproteobacteria bacterium]
MLRPALDAGLEAHRRGDLEAAKTAFQRALGMAPDDPDALHLYGATLIQTGEAETALEYLQRAARQRRNDPAIAGNLAQAYFVLKRYDEARETFRKASRLDPRTLQFPLGVANSLAMQGQLEVAQELLQKLATRFPQSALVWFNLGNVQRDRQHVNQALESFRRAVALDPRQIDARNSLGCVLHVMLRFEDAEREFRECVRIAPDFLHARCNLASVVMDLGRFDEAATLCRDIIALAPDLALAHSFLGATLSHQGLLLAALASHRTATRLSPHEAKVAQTYATTLADAGRFMQSLPWFARALALNPDLNSTHQLLAYALLGHGCLAEGWNEYRYRPWPSLFRTEYPHLELSQTLPVDLRGKHICVLREQGLGDEIFFLRFVPDMHAADARITYCASGKITALLERVSSLAQVVDQIAPPADADATVLVGDLPHLCSASPASTLPLVHTADPQAPVTRWPVRIEVFWPAVPLPLPLVPLAARMLEIRERLTQAGPGPYLGLTWRGGTPPREQRAVIWVLHKEIGIAPLAAALHDVRGTFIAVQRNPQPGEIESLSTAVGQRVHDFSDLNEDLEGMLALMALLDDYIGVSNTNTHLRAGAGKTARVLVPSPPDWRWMMNHSRTSPWFPGFLVYRQSVQGDWGAALAELKKDLERVAH